MVKADLLRLLADKNRGLQASTAAKQEIELGIAAIEATNPTTQPLQQPDLLGDWRLIYTTSTSLLNLGRIPLCHLGNIYQCIRSGNIYNIAEINSLPYLSSVVSVVASYQPLSDCRVKVDFRRSVAGLQTVVDYQSPGAWIEKLNSGQKLLAVDFPIDNPKANSWLDVTYLDADLRISRGNQGSVFVLTKD
jgi:PAP_fibrillin